MVTLPDGTTINAVIRDGVLCACGPSHGVFAECVGSRSPAAELLGLSNTRRPATAVYRYSNDDDPAIWNFFLIGRDDVVGRGSRPFNNADIQECADCGFVGHARRYCDTHRALARFNVLEKAQSDDMMTTLHLMVAERGIDLTV